MLTVTTAATKFNLIDVATARTALSITDNSENEILSELIDRASDVIARHCRRVFALEVVTEQFRPDHCLRELVLARFPVVEITSITEGADTLVASTDFEVDNINGTVTRLHRDRVCHWSRCKTIVTYSAGYNLPNDTPPALQQAAVQLDKAYWHASDRDPSLRSQDLPGVFTASYLDIEHLPIDVRGLVAPFRNYRAG
jgi:hypothetical protein